MTCCLLLVWGVVSSAGWAEHEWVGLGVLSIAMAWGLAFNFHLRANTVSAFRAVQHHITFRMLEQNEKRAMHVALRKELGVPLILGSLATTNGGTTASTTSTTSTTTTESKETKEGKADEKVEADNGLVQNSTSLNMEIDVIVSELQKLEQDTMDKWTSNSFRAYYGKEAGTDLENPTTTETETETLEGSLERMNFLHRRLCEHRILAGRRECAYQVLILSNASARMERRKRLLNDVIEGISTELQLNTEVLNIGSTTVQQKQKILCKKIRSSIHP